MAVTLHILLVEDREDDILLIRKAFKTAGVPNPIQSVRNGEDAVAYLCGHGKYSNSAQHPLPALVLLDLKLPGMDGFELLTWIRKQDGLRGLPVLILTSSINLKDVDHAYQLGANSFFIKETDFQGSLNFSRLLRDYWLNTVLTPVSRADSQPPETASLGEASAGE